MLRDLPRAFDENLLVGFQTDDDAAVYRLGNGQLLLQTVDFFPPMVDDPYTFGQIAAANALSDIYAMGGVPKLALNLFAFPSDKLAPAYAREILRGGAQKVMEAGAFLCGGHTIEDKEPKYGLCVTGFVSEGELLTNSGAKVGDQLILTKPLGSGILTTAAKAGLLSRPILDAMTSVMASLNAAAHQATKGLEVHACTDITGFGLLGHCCELLRASAVGAKLYANRAPLMDEVLSFAQMGMIPAGAYRNRQHFCNDVLLDDAVPLELSDVLFDPQTSGGLLLSISPKDAPTLLTRLSQAGLCAAQIGEVCSDTFPRVHVLG